MQKGLSKGEVRRVLGQASSAADKLTIAASLGASDSTRPHVRKNGFGSNSSGFHSATCLPSLEMNVPKSTFR